MTARAESDAEGAARPAPQGQAETVSEVIRVARRLFGRHGPAAVTMQQIADEAQVNRGLMHRHFGSKEDVVAAVFRDASDEAAAAIRRCSDPKEALAILRDQAHDSGYAAMLAWAVLTGIEPERLLGRSPALAALFELLPETTDPIAAPPAPEDRSSDSEARPESDANRSDGRMVLAVALSASLGWKLFGTFLSDIGGLDDWSADDLHRELGDVIDTLVDRSLGTNRGSGVGDAPPGDSE